MGYGCSESFPLSPGDVTIELPGKTGTFSYKQAIEYFSAKENQTFGLEGPGAESDLLPISDILQDLESQLNSSEIPQAYRGTMESFADFLTNESAGALFCGVANNVPGLYATRSWRPYKWTVGYHDAVWSCLGDYWKGEGGDSTVELDYTMALDGSRGVAGQRFKAGSISSGGYIASRVAKAGKVTPAEMEACCFPASESERDCKAVKKVVADYKDT